MPRSARIAISDYPHHIIQRGHNRQVVLVSDDDYPYYLDNLHEWKERLECKVYAYCLMANHVHIIIDPGSDRKNLALLMKRIAGRQTRHVNRLSNRSGMLWEGRYKSSPICVNEYLLACSRYVELNPVRAGIVTEAEAYRWSSYGVRCGPQDQPARFRSPISWVGINREKTSGEVQKLLSRNNSGKRIGADTPGNIAGSVNGQPPIHESN